MSKTIIIMRHAHTETYAEGGDQQRSLTNQGRQAADSVAHEWALKYPHPEHILYSSAKRTTQTAAIVGQQFTHVPLTEVDKLYYASPRDIDAIIADISDDISSVALIGHNNTVTDYLNHKIKQFKIDHLPPSGLVALTLDIDKWADNNYTMEGDYLFHIIKN